MRSCRATCARVATCLLKASTQRCNSSCCRPGRLSRPRHSSVLSRSSESGPMAVRCVAMVRVAASRRPRDAWVVLAMPVWGRVRDSHCAQAVLPCRGPACGVGGGVVSFKFVIASRSKLLCSRVFGQLALRSRVFGPSLSWRVRVFGPSGWRDQPPLASVASFPRLWPVGSAWSGQKS